MRTQNTFSTLFLVQKPKAINNEALLYARVTVNGKRADISLKRKFPYHFGIVRRKKSKEIQMRLDK